MLQLSSGSETMGDAQHSNPGQLCYLSLSEVCPAILTSRMLLAVEVLPAEMLRLRGGKKRDRKQFQRVNFATLLRVPNATPGIDMHDGGSRISHQSARKWRRCLKVLYPPASALSRLSIDSADAGTGGGASPIVVALVPFTDSADAGQSRRSRHVFAPRR